MDPIVIAIICAASFGVVVGVSVFIRNLLLGRDKRLNDKAQQVALHQETQELEKMRLQMLNPKRFDSHYKVLGTNKDAIFYLDSKIDDILNKKTQLIERYSQMSLKESSAIMDGILSSTRKNACDLLKQEIDKEIKFYDMELEQLQQRRVALWDTHTELQDYLLLQESSRNKHLDEVYKQHSGLLEKVFIRHLDHTEHVATKTIDSGTSAFKLILAPVQFLLQFFNISSGIALAQAKIEQESRSKIDDIESDINDSEDNYDDEDTKDIENASEGAENDILFTKIPSLFTA